MVQTSRSVLLEQLAAEGRAVLSVWRTLIFLRRATFAISPSQRRWTKLPETAADVRPLLSQMHKRGEITPFRKTVGLYQVTVPYATRFIVGEEEVLMEAHPYCALSHLSALIFHGLSNQLAKGLSAIYPADGTGDELPIGTLAEDWEGLPLVHGRKIASVLGRPVRWKSVRADHYFGVREYRRHEYPVRITTPERTLLDGLQQPELCGGLDNVLRAWVDGRDRIDLDAVIHYTDRLDTGILRQRVGFVLEEMGITLPALDEWRPRAQRGGSSKLVSSAAYSSAYSEHWNLSINASVTPLQEVGR